MTDLGYGILAVKNEGERIKYGNGFIGYRYREPKHKPDILELIDYAKSVVKRDSWFEIRADDTKLILKALRFYKKAGRK
jgi:hypothetical protein